MRRLASHTSALSSLKRSTKPKPQILRAKVKERKERVVEEESTLNEEYKLDVMKLD